MSHHHHHHHHHSSLCCCNCNNCCSSSSSSNSDELLQALLLIHSQSSPPPQPSIFIKPQTHRHLRTSKPKEYDDSSSSSLLHSLIRRVAALESSLSNLSSSPSPSPPKRQTPQQLRGQSSLKHAAAATIQRFFRRFLARRSRTLRDLELLASIKSHAASLRSSLSNSKNPKAISHKAMDLLLHLDSLQSSDPTIREGKRSVSKELVRISEFADKVLIRGKEDELEELERRMDRARRMRFAVDENGDGDDDEVFNDLLQRNPLEEEEEEVQGFYVPLRDDGEGSPRVIRHDRVSSNSNRGIRMSNGGLALTAPSPVKMEPRRSGSLKKVAFDEE